MKKLFGVLVVAAALSGCGGESGEKSKNNGNQQAANNENDSQSSGKAEKQDPKQASSGGRTDGMFTARANLQDTNRLKMLALAIMNFHDTYRKFPMSNSEGGMKRNKNLSWRVAILPYAELSHEFERFKVEEPWDSPQNKPLTNGRGKDPFVLGNGNLVCTIKHEVQPNSFRDILDGSSNTVMLMENPNAKPDQWTQAVDLTPDDAIKLVKDLKKGEFLLGTLYDGSTVKIYSLEGKDISDQDLKAVFGYKDGTATNFEVFQPGK